VNEHETELQPEEANALRYALSKAPESKALQQFEPGGKDLGTMLAAIQAGALPRSEYTKNVADMARDLRSIQGIHYLRMTPDALFKQKWPGGSSEEMRSYTKSFNDQIYLLASLMLQENSSPEARANLLKFFIDVAITALRAKDYATVFMVRAALENSSVKRMTSAWDIVRGDSTYSRRLAKLQTSFENYRKEIKRRGIETAVPYLGQTETDLEFLATGNARVDEKGLYNIAPFMKMHREIWSALSGQQRLRNELQPLNTNFNQLVSEFRYESGNQVENMLNGRLQGLRDGGFERKRASTA
jgi:hypothetical protein